MSTSNRTTKFKNVKTYDFQTLYNKIPHMLKGKLEEFIGYVFHIKESKYINIRNKYFQIPELQNLVLQKMNSKQT